MLDKQSPDNTIQVSIKLPIELHNKILQMANKSHRTKSGQFRFMLEEYIRFKEEI